MIQITLKDFAEVQLIAGTVVSVKDLPEIRKPSYRIEVDFGPEVGIKKTSSQVKDLYSKIDLMGHQVIGLVNIPTKQVGPMMSEFLLVGFYRDDGTVVLAVPERPVADGSRLA
ncbi:MAG: tRNA-binding protein [Deltaproteobacteria bacterium]|jgi:tRNA-binding protein|nr:tRNA-binding protein [Deltaproteobacteria bacterium]